MPGEIDLWTVLLSFAIATLAGFVAFESIEHTRFTSNPRLWTFISGVTLGLGIWSMHFVGMLAWKPPYPLYYSLGRTVLSVVVAILASWLAMQITVNHHEASPQHHLLGGAVLVGTGICGMHYLGMSAMHFTQPVLWSTPGVMLSYLIAIFASLGAVALLQRGAGRLGLLRQIGASLVIGLAICGMHYTGMMSMSVPVDAVCVRQGLSFSGSLLARIGVGNAMLLTLCLLVALRRSPRMSEQQAQVA